MEAKERARRWYWDNLERAKRNQIKALETRRISREEALKRIKKAKYKTPMSAIKAFCRKCPNGTSRQGKNYLNALVSCKNKRCVFYCFRNGNPAHIKLGLKQDMEKIRKKIL